MCLRCNQARGASCSGVKQHTQQQAGAHSAQLHAPALAHMSAVVRPLRPPPAMQTSHVASSVRRGRVGATSSWRQQLEMEPKVAGPAEPGFVRRGCGSCKSCLREREKRCAHSKRRRPRAPGRRRAAHLLAGRHAPGTCRWPLS